MYMIDLGSKVSRKVKKMHNPKLLRLQFLKSAGFIHAIPTNYLES